MGANVHRDAFGATVLALVLYVIACSVVDLVVVDRLNTSIHTRLTTRLRQVAPTLPPGGPEGTICSYSPQFSGDYDDAPVVLWWVPRSPMAAIGLDSNGPRLPASAVATVSPRDATVGGFSFRLEGILVGDGRLAPASACLFADAVVRATSGTFEVGQAPLGGARVAVSWPRHSAA